MSPNHFPNPEGQGLKKCPTSRKYVSMNFLYLSVGSGEISETSNLKIKIKNGKCVLYSKFRKAMNDSQDLNFYSCKKINGCL